MTIPLMIPDTVSGRIILKKMAAFPDSQIAGRLNPVFTDSCHGVINRQQHKRQEVVYHAKDNGCRCIYDIDAGKPENL